jgi:hypothetical protein
LTYEIDLHESPAWLLTAIRTLTKTAISKVFEKVRETPNKNAASRHAIHIDGER